MNTNESKSWVFRHLSKILLGLVLLASMLATFVAGLYVRSFRGELSDDPAVWAQFGDYIGGTLNSTFAFFALIALALTLRVQSIELNLSTTELKNSAKALADQNKALATQNFENTFFQLLRLHNDIVKGLDLRRDKVVIAQGRDCFSIFYTRLRGEMQAHLRGNYLEDGFEKSYQNFFDKNEQNLGHYFRHLYRIYKFVHESTVADKQNYTGIVRAQLSSNELALLFYNGASRHGAKFKDLMERYALFENLDPAWLIDWSEDKDRYLATAFGEQAHELFDMDR